MKPRIDGRGIVDYRPRCTLILVESKSGTFFLLEGARDCPHVDPECANPGCACPMRGEWRKLGTE